MTQTQVTADFGVVPPRWTHTADVMLAWAERATRLLGCATPLELDEVSSRLAEGLMRGAPSAPELRYPSPCAEDPRPVLERAAEAFSELGPLGTLYADRARELWLEASMSRAMGTGALPRLAAERYRRRDEHHDAADALADRWLESVEDPLDAATEERISSDDERDERSLLSRLRQEVGRHRLAFRVVVSDRIASLAATGPQTVYVAAGRRLLREDVERTVLHELEGHVLPRARACQLPGIFSGTAYGSDDQEGRALFIERRQGRLGGSRRRELARRHFACRLVRQQADVVETSRALMQDAGASAHDAARVSLRAHRGGGLARESVYLPALLRVQEALGARPELDHLLGAGQVSVDAAPILARLFPQG